MKNIINIQKLDEGLDKASADKVDLFDFYNKNWCRVVEAIEKAFKQGFEFGRDSPDASAEEVSAEYQLRANQDPFKE